MSELEFWYDFHSPWAYLAATQIEALAARHGLAVAWRPLHLPRLIEAIDGRRPMEENGAFLAWYKQDLQDWAELYGLSLRYHPDYPLRPARALRASLRAAELGQAPGLRARRLPRLLEREPRHLRPGNPRRDCDRLRPRRRGDPRRRHGQSLWREIGSQYPRGHRARNLRRAQHHLPRQALLRQRPPRPAGPLARRRGPAGIRALLASLALSTVMCGWPPASKGFSRSGSDGHLRSCVRPLIAAEAAGPDGFRGSRPDHGRGVSKPQ